MATKPKTEEPTEIKEPAELTAEEINILYQLAKQATIRVTEINKVYSTLMHVEHYLSANLK